MIYLVNEVFETIQGEAKFTGTPAIFLRLQGCPVGCGWCDTKHTWELNFSDQTPIPLMLAKQKDSPKHARASVDDILEIVCKFQAKHVVITGGEPCLYNLNELTQALIASGRTVQIETSGTHKIQAHSSTWITVSPKVGMPGGFKMLDSALALANEIKFPVGKLRDIMVLIGLLQEISNKPLVWLQPLSQSVKATEICVKAATRYGWKVSIQTHKYMGVR